MEKIKVVIADDSVVYRTQIKKALDTLKEVRVVATAANGRLAIEKIKQTDADLLILDLEMPEMNGLDTLKEMKNQKINCCTLVFSSASKSGSEKAMEALKWGAKDFVLKPSASQTHRDQATPEQILRDALYPKIKAFFYDFSKRTKPIVTENITYGAIAWDKFSPDILIIGASTGGPTVIENLLTGLNIKFCCPVVIVQHMPPLFTATFAERIEKVSGVRCTEAHDGAVLEENHIYIAPGNYHLVLERHLNDTICVLNQHEPIHSVRPAVDPLFISAARIYNENCLAIVLTGMGYDGQRGSIEVKERGGAVVIQDKASAIVYGMPGAVFDSGAYDLVATPNEIITLLRNKCEKKLPLKGSKYA